VAEAISTGETVYHTYDDDGVLVEPFTPSVAQDALDEPLHRREAPVPSVHVPSRAERPQGQRRMPRTEELPAVARRSLTATEKHDGEARNARALFKRLASNVGFNLRAAEEGSAEGGESGGAEDAAARTAIEAGISRVSPAVAPPAGAQGTLDPHGRAAPQPAQKEHLEIPAFLRKHG
jgi:cell division protein FtsZ